jgi:hypothetical protein
MTPSRYLKIVGFSFVALLLVVLTARQLIVWTAETARINSEYKAHMVAQLNLNECSLAVTRQSLASDPRRVAADPRRVAADILPVVLTNCRSEYQANQTAASDEAATKVQLLELIGEEVGGQKIIREERRKVALIKAAIKSLEKQGVTEDDIREYFREEETEDER